jgi:hypothetical protein
MVKNFICDKYGGIRQKTAQFSDNVITCSDMQNVELFYTGVNAGVGIRTVKGQKGLKQIPNGERVVNIFESIQKSKSNCFIHAISEKDNVYELTDGENIAYTPIVGLSGNKISEKELIYKDSQCSSVHGNLATTLSVVSSNSDLVINNNYSGTKEEIGTEVKTFGYKNEYNYNKSFLSYFGEIENYFDKTTGTIKGFNKDNYIELTDLNYNLFSGAVSYPTKIGQYKELGTCRECCFDYNAIFGSNNKKILVELIINNGFSVGTINPTNLPSSIGRFKLGKLKTYMHELGGKRLYLEIVYTDIIGDDYKREVDITPRSAILPNLTYINSLTFRIGSSDKYYNNVDFLLSDSYIVDNNGEKKYFAEAIGSGWFDENKEKVNLGDYSIEALGSPKIDDTLTLTYNTKQVLLNSFTYTGKTLDGYSKLYQYDFATETLKQKITGLKRQLVSSGVDYKQGYDDCFVFCNKEDNLYKIQLDKKVTAYQVKCDDTIGYVANNGLGSIPVGETVFSDTNLTIPYKVIKTVYEVKQDENIGYTDVQGTTDTFVVSGNFIYSDSKLTQIITESTGEDFKYTGKTKQDYDFKYTGYVDKEVSELELVDAENRPIKPNFICTADNRIYGAIKNRLHASMQQNIYDWQLGDTDKPTSAYYIEFSKDITAITPYLGSSIAVFFRDSSLLVKGSYPELQVTEEAPGGCANYKSLVFHGTDLFFYDDTKKGIYSFQQVVLGNKTLGKDIALEINDVLNVIDVSRMEDLKFTSYVADDRNEIWFLLPTADPDYSTILIYDSLRDEWIKRKSKKIYCVEHINNILLSGGTSLYQEYTGNDFDGEFIQNYYNCSPFNLGSNTTMKILYLRPRMSVCFPYTNEFYVKYQKNFNTFKKPKIKRVKSKFKNYLIWGQGTWGVNYWAGGTTNTILKLPNVSAFKTINISFYTTNSKENFAIRNMEMNQVDSIQT